MSLPSSSENTCSQHGSSDVKDTHDQVNYRSRRQEGSDEGTADSSWPANSGKALVKQEKVIGCKEQCPSINENRGPLEAAYICAECKDGWRDTFAETFSHQPSIALEKGPQDTKSSSSKNEASATKKDVQQFKVEDEFILNPYDYALGLNVEIFVGKSGKNGGWVPGTLVDMQPTYVKVHYKGLESTCDEWFIAGSRRIRIVSQQEASNTTSSSKSALRSSKLMAVEGKKRMKLQKKDFPGASTIEKKRPVHAAATSHRKLAKRRENTRHAKLLRENTTNTDRQQFISLRLALANANKHKDFRQFPPNLYGYFHLQHVMVRQVDNSDHEGRLVKIRDGKVKVHYCGWDDSYDEYLALDSKRIQSIEPCAQPIDCLEPDYFSLQEGEAEKDTHIPPTEASLPTCSSTSGPVFQKRMRADCKRKRTSKKVSKTYQSMKREKKSGTKDTITCKSKIYCCQCQSTIEQFRFYCMYCEVSGSDTKFELCLQCFDCKFPSWHDHPRSSFAVQSIMDYKEIDPALSCKEGPLVKTWEEDILENNLSDICSTKKSIEASQVFAECTTTTSSDQQNYSFLQRWKHRKICAFCNDDSDSSEELGCFVGPFVVIHRGKKEHRKSFWAHDACARYSPEVLCTPEGKWYNVAVALKRSRSIRCYACKERGATIGCFEAKCTKSFHLACTGKSVSCFKDGLIFQCNLHEAYYDKKDAYIDVFHCDGCSREFSNTEVWFTCGPCTSNYFSSYDLCLKCYAGPDSDHQHEKSDFSETSFEIIQQTVTEARQQEEGWKQKKVALLSTAVTPPHKHEKEVSDPSISCYYCGTREAEVWQKGYNEGIDMCSACFQVSLEEMAISGNGHLKQLEEYSYKPYFTRSSSCYREPRSVTSYEPQPNQVFSLTFDSTYYDIPGRAPRWATHSGTDYHGTWLPQTVRRALLKYTSKNERVLSNFLGRGTDAIECLLLQRRCCGIDINPSAVTLSKHNCSFDIPSDLIPTKHRPIITQADARQLTGILFQNETYHHILSHPPYKDCVAYSTHLEGDLSRFAKINDFLREYAQVVNESWRVLKMDRRLTLGIGDNREHRFYIPVGFNLMRLYIDQGFELEELIVKRQRYCSAYGLGTYLCVQFDFLIFTHEFIATFRKIPLCNIDRMILSDIHDPVQIQYQATLYAIPTSPIPRNSAVMGTVWTFKSLDNYSFPHMCMSRMVEKFGQDNCNWEHIDLAIIDHQAPSQKTPGGNEGGATTDDLYMDIPASDQQISDYERERQRKILENSQTLLRLGLVSELGQDSTNDNIHYEAMMNNKPYVEAKLALILTAHYDNLPSCQIPSYRACLMKLAQEAVVRLADTGKFIVGTKDVRDPMNGKLWPLSLLVLEDIQRVIDPHQMKLREMVITVPQGYSRERDEELPASGEESEHLPVVHAVYLVFQKL